MNEIIKAAKGFKGRGYGYAKLKKTWTETVWALAKKAELRPVKRAWFRFLWIEPNKKRNPDNVAAGGRKMVFDGLVTAKVIENDGWGQVAGWADSFAVGHTPGVRVEIEEIGENQP